jgi:glycosyltransferase involved in cell wall biosynthesis
MRICFVNSWYAPFGKGGAERSVKTVAEELARKGHEVVVITAAAAQYSTEELSGVTVVRLPIRNIYSHAEQPNVSKTQKAVWRLLDDVNLIAARDVHRTLSDIDPDIVHTNCTYGFSPFVASARLSPRTRIVHTPRDYYLFCWRASMFRQGHACANPCFSCRVLTAPRRSGLANLDALLFISKFSQRAHLRLMPSLAQFKQTVVYNPVKPTAQQAASSKKNYTLGYLGTLSSAKGIHLFIEAINRDPSLHGVVAGVGDTTFVAALHAGADPDRIDFMGFASPAQLFSRIDALVVPSLWDEPFGRVVIEALGHGLPVIGAKRGGIPELISPGITGEIFEPSEPGALDSAIARIRAAKDPSRISMDAIKAAQDFAPDKIAQQYVHFYAQVLENRKS